MKKFIIISLMTAMTLSTFACAWPGTDNYYLFRPYYAQSFKSRVEKNCNDNWKAYIGDTSTDDWYSFHDDDVLKAARQKKDALMVSYVQNLQKYLKCVSVEQDKQYEWGYPTKEEIAAQQRDLKAVRTYAQSKTSSKLRSQHALLYMRCNMMLGQHQENIRFWEQTASQFIETVYKDMMKNIYAGALYKTGREMEAGQLFAEMDDYESLMTLYYQKRSYQAIRQHYMQNPTSKALPWLLTDFVNNAQEAADAITGGGGAVGKQFIRDINNQESSQMQQFCEVVVKEGKTDCPIMWKMAKAWLEFLSGKKREAVDDILAATKLDGTARMKDNAHVLLLYITGSQAKSGQTFDDYIADELEWLKGKQKEHEWGDGFFDEVENRFTNQVLIPHYKSNPIRLAAVCRALNSSGSGFDLDTLNVASLEKYLYYTNTPANTKFDKFLKRNLHENDTTMSELIGTKYMRLCQWDKAIQWLNTVPISYYNEHRTKEYLYYSLVRQWNVEPWSKRQWIDDSQAWWERDHKWGKHRKLDFCKEVQSMENSLSRLNGKALEERCYNLAVRYAQASIHGDCWWLLRDFKSCMDTVRVHEVDLGQKAVQMLQKAVKSSDQSLKRKALFALGYRELYNDMKGVHFWQYSQYSEQAHEYLTYYDRQSPQFLAFQMLYDETGDQPQEDYIRRCDEYAQFRKYYRQHK